jgi:hypothetical protein
LETPAKAIGSNERKINKKNNFGVMALAIPNGSHPGDFDIRLPFQACCMITIVRLVNKPGEDTGKSQNKEQPILLQWHFFLLDLLSLKT